MTSLKPGDQDEKPLDPAMENVRRKMVRLMIVSGTVMVVSLMAVFGAIVYKAMRPTAKSPAAAGVPSDAPVSASVGLPAGFVVQSTSLSGNQMLFYGVTEAGQHQAIVFDYATGHVVATVSVSAN
jgi:hypothetical protein